MLIACDLLSICAEGEKKFPEDLCQTIFSLEELIKCASLFLLGQVYYVLLMHFCLYNSLRILQDETIPIERKKPFTSLLMESYLITERQSLKTIFKLTNSKFVFFLIALYFHNH